MSKSSVIDEQPFPRLRWEEFLWEGKAVLHAWKNFQSRGGAYAASDSDEESDGSARLYVSSPIEDHPEPPSLAQRRAYEQLLSKQESVRESLLSKLLPKYRTWRKKWSTTANKALLDEIMPEVATLADFRNLVGLSIIHVLAVEKNGLAYIGFEFGCCWDEEHGLGFMTHNGSVIEIGGADTSFLEWIAERDAI